jgi:hypothetical protein
MSSEQAKRADKKSKHTPHVVPHQVGYRKSITGPMTL